MKKGILIVSFGTSYDEAREKTIVVFEKEIREKFPEHMIETAFTSNRVRQILEEKQIFIKNVPLAIESLLQQGVEEIFVMATHLIPGEEYEKLCKQVEEKRKEFKKVVVGPPLFFDTENMKELLSVLTSEVPVSSDEALVLFGHGTAHFSNAIYPALDYVAKAEGMAYVFVGTVEGYPDFPAILKALQQSTYKKAVVTPLMLVAGDHAQNDMAGEDVDSWKNQLEQAGIQCRMVVKGIGEYSAIRQMYYRTLLELV